MKHTIADLNDKVKSAEEEKASLITAIKLLYKEKEGNEDQINVSQVEQIYSDESPRQQHGRTFLCSVYTPNSLLISIDTAIKCLNQ